MGFLAGFGAGFDAVAESWVDSVAGFALDCVNTCLMWREFWGLVFGWWISEVDVSGGCYLSRSAPLLYLTWT